jgi:hypothetical protein
LLPRHSTAILSRVTSRRWAVSTCTRAARTHPKQSVPYGRQAAGGVPILASESDEAFRALACIAGMVSPPDRSAGSRVGARAPPPPAPRAGPLCGTRHLTSACPGPVRRSAAQQLRTTCTTPVSRSTSCTRRATSSLQRRLVKAAKITSARKRCGLSAAGRHTGSTDAVGRSGVGSLWNPWHTVRIFLELLVILHPPMSHRRWVMSPWTVRSIPMSL